MNGMVDDRLVKRLTRAAAYLSDAMDVEQGAELVAAGASFLLSLLMDEC